MNEPGKLTKQIKQSKFISMPEFITTVCMLVHFPGTQNICICMIDFVHKTADSYSVNCVYRGVVGILKVMHAISKSIDIPTVIG